MKKHFIVFFLFLVLGIGLFINMIVQTGPAQIWSTLRNFSFLFFLVYLTLSSLNFGLYTLRWKLILQALLKREKAPRFRKTVSFFDLFFHRMAGFAIGYLTPTAQTGGEPLRILLLHRDGIRMSLSTASVIIDKALEYSTLMIFIVIGIFLALLDGSFPAGSRVFFGGVLVTFFVLIFWFYYASLKNIGFFSSLLRFFHLHKFSKIEKAIKKIVKVEAQMAAFYKQNGHIFLILILISIIITGFQLFEHYMLALFFGVKMTFFQTFLVSTIPYLAYIVPIPGSLGILESGHAMMFALLGIHINAFVLVFIIRIRDFVFVLLGLIHASKEGLRMLREAFGNR